MSSNHRSVCSFLGQADRTIRHLILNSRDYAGFHYLNKAGHIAPAFAHTVFEDHMNGGTINEIAVSISERAAIPAIVAPSADDFWVNIRPRRDIQNTSFLQGKPLDKDKLVDTCFKDRASENLVVYIGPVIKPFVFNVEPVSGDMSTAEVKERMEDSCGESARFWVESLYEANAKGADIWKVLDAVGADAIKSWFPTIDKDFVLRRGMGACDVIPISKDTSPQSFDAIESAMAHVIQQAVPATVPIVHAPVASLTLAEKQIKSKMRHSVTRFRANMMCAKLNFKVGSMEDYAVPELSDKYLKIVSSDAGTTVNNAQFKSLLDSANKATNAAMEGMILMASRCMPDHDPNLATAFCMGNWMQTPLADLGRESLSYSIWQHGKESEIKRDKRKEQEETAMAEDLVAEETTNKTKKRLLINHVRAVAEPQHFFQLIANWNSDISACVKVLTTAPILYQALHHLFTVVSDKYVKDWYTKNNSAQPQFWIWVVQILDRLQAGIASAGGDIDNMEAVEKKDMTELNTMAYSHPFERFCDDISELRRMSRSERPLDIVPSITPEYLKPGASSKRLKTDDAKVPSNAKGGANKTANARPQVPPSQLAWNGSNAGHYGGSGSGGNAGHNGGSGGNNWSGNGWGSANNSFGGGGFNSGWNRNANQNGGRQPGDPTKGDFIRLGNHPFVLAKPLKDRKCKARLTVGMVCTHGKECKYDHTSFDRWSDQDKQTQIEFVKANTQKLGFNRDSVKTLPQALAGLLRAPVDGGEARA